VIKLRVPLDAEINMREVANEKMRKIKLMNKIFISRFPFVSFCFGLTFTVFSQVASPSKINLIFLIAYASVFVFWKFFGERKEYGRIIDGRTGSPVPFAILNIFSHEREKLGFLVSDQLGRYYGLIEDGSYILEFKGETLDGRNFRFEKEISVKSGMLKENFEI